MKTSELTGAALDWAVAKCEGWDYLAEQYKGVPYQPITDWAQGGPIIEREKVQISYGHGLGAKMWFAERYRNYSMGRDTTSQQYGETPLTAAMRCYVASKLGDEVDVPSEILK